jgi:hypothetical protein
MVKELENNNILNLLQISKNENKDPEEENNIPTKGTFDVFCHIKEERWKLGRIPVRAR